MYDLADDSFPKNVHPDLLSVQDTLDDLTEERDKYRGQSLTLVRELADIAKLLGVSPNYEDVTAAIRTMRSALSALTAQRAAASSAPAEHAPLTGLEIARLRGMLTRVAGF